MAGATDPKPGYNIIKEALAREPTIPARTLAKRLVALHPLLWKNLEDCRRAIRYQIGQCGNRNRVRSITKSSFREANTEWARVIPKPFVSEEWSEFVIEGPQRILVLNDIHIPFHSNIALEIALSEGLKKNPTIVLLNGDLADFYEISRWEKNPEHRNFKGEVKAIRQFLKGLRQKFPEARIIYKHGNHEERYEKHMWSRCPEFLGIRDFEFSKVFRLKKYDIELVAQKRPIRAGKLAIIHGHEYSFAISNPVNPARGLFLRAKAHAACGHFHQSSDHTERSIKQEVIVTYSFGCLCNLHPEYRPLNNWNHSFGFIDLKANGNFHVTDHKIIDGVLI